jgi:hypothetical protein
MILQVNLSKSIVLLWLIWWQTDAARDLVAANPARSIKKQMEGEGGGYTQSSNIPKAKKSYKPMGSRLTQ